MLRVNSNSNKKLSLKINLDDEIFTFQIEDKIIPLNEIKAIWYRKGKNWLCDQFLPVELKMHSELCKFLNNRLKQEETDLSEYIHHIIQRNTPTLGYREKKINKLIVLSTAKSVGLLIPPTVITNSKETIIDLFNVSPNLITKPISDGIYLFEKFKSMTGYFSYTEKLDYNIIKYLSDTISPSLIQKNIIKKLDLRVFYLDSICYSMAIHSQSEEQTMIDFRKYNEKRPSRFVPFLLPKEIEQKIISLFKKLNLDTGSADLILDQEENYYFLEINPVGQFGMLSEPCNFFLEKQIALNLISKTKNGK